MARPQINDHMQSHRFHARVIGEDDPLIYVPQAGAGSAAGPEAGFQSITVPELSVDPVEYREGIYVYTRKYPGVPQVSDCSLMRGIARFDTTFHDWILRCVNQEPSQEYRKDLMIWHYARGEATVDDTNGYIPSGARILYLYNAFPVRAKSSGDLDSTSGEVSMAEIDLAVESFGIVLNEAA
jgi:phage tail-like protein